MVGGTGVLGRQPAERHFTPGSRALSRSRSADVCAVRGGTGSARGIAVRIIVRGHARDRGHRPARAQPVGLPNGGTGPQPGGAGDGLVVPRSHRCRVGALDDRHGRWGCWAAATAAGVASAGGRTGAHRRQRAGERTRRASGGRCTAVHRRGIRPGSGGAGRHAVADRRRDGGSGRDAAGNPRPARHRHQHPRGGRRPSRTGSRPGPRALRGGSGSGGRLGPTES